MLFKQNKYNKDWYKQMELRIENFTPGGNNLAFLEPFHKFEMDKCVSKSKFVAENKEYYNRMLNVLTDNRSIDVLNKDSTATVDKITKRSEATFGKGVYVSIDGKTVEIKASVRGVEAVGNDTAVGKSEMFLSLTTTGDGIVRFTDPSQLQVPKGLPPPVPITTFDKFGVPSTNPLSLREHGLRLRERLEEYREADARGEVPNLSTGGATPQQIARYNEAAMSPSVSTYSSDGTIYTSNGTIYSSNGKLFKIPTGRSTMFEGMTIASQEKFEKAKAESMARFPAFYENRRLASGATIIPPASSTYDMARQTDA